MIHEGVTRAFKAIIQGQSLIPNWAPSIQVPPRCLNTVYRWFTSRLLDPIDSHLSEYDLAQLVKRGARRNCYYNGTTDNFVIDRMAIQDCHRSNQNLSIAWIHVNKEEFDSIDHGWINEMTAVHRFPKLPTIAVCCLSFCWNTRIVVRKKQGCEQTNIIRFTKGLPHGDALCLKLFTLFLNSLAWMMWI